MTSTMRHVYWSTRTTDGDAERTKKVTFMLNQADLTWEDIKTLDVELELIWRKLVELNQWVKDRQKARKQEAAK